MPTDLDKSGANDLTERIYHGPSLGWFQDPSLATGVDVGTDPLLTVSTPGAVTTLANDELPMVVSVIQGNVTSPVTARRPTIAVSRQEAITETADGAQNAAIYARVDSNNVSVAGSNPQTNGILARLSAHGAGDACAIFGDVTVTGTGESYGGFFHIDARGGTRGGNGAEVGVDNNTGIDGFVAFPSQHETVGLNLEAGGANRNAVAINIASDPGGTWDGGIRFGSHINTLMYAGSWLNGVNGIDISAATFSGNAFHSPGFTVDGLGNLSALSLVETGSWTPFTCTITPATGSITTQSSTSKYKKIGRTVFVSIDVGVSNVGTGAGTPSLSLPFATGGQMVIPGRETAISGKTLSGIAGNGASAISLFNYDNTNPTLSNGINYVMTGVYMSAT